MPSNHFGLSVFVRVSSLTVSSRVRTFAPGESVYAVVQAKPGETIDLTQLRAFVEERLAGYKRPRRYELRDELPRTDAGKLLKRVLRDEFWRDRATAV